MTRLAASAAGAQGPKCRTFIDRLRKVAVTIAAAVVLADSLGAAAAAQTKHPLPPATPAPLKAASKKLPGGQLVIDFLSGTIGWYRELAAQEGMAQEPADVLYVADQRQFANEVLALSFAYARAQVQLLAKTAPQRAAKAAASVGAAHPGPSIAQQLAQAANAAEQALNAAQLKVEAINQRLRTAKPDQRKAILSELTVAQSQLDLDQVRSDALNNIVKFEASSEQSEKREAGLLGEIDELEKSVPTSERNPKMLAVATARAMRRAEPTGIIGLLGSLFGLERKLTMIGHATDAATKLADSADALHQPLIDELHAIDRRADELARQSAAVSTSAAALRQRRLDFQELIELRKLAAAAAIPLAKQSVVLDLYTRSLAHWEAAVDQRWKGELRQLVARLVALGLLLGLIFVAAALWRRFAFRYVQDVHRRHQLLQARQLVLALVVAMVLLLNFANELGAVATVMGFAAAGIALALQNVILSVAGYFFLIGKFGIKAGDRVQISGVTGDVIDIGLVKLTLLELAGNQSDHQPTGRVVVFSNAVVFQPNGNFSKQVPGTSFVWNQVSFTLAPDCDYRLVEERLLKAVDEVFARYRERIQRQYRKMERTLNMAVEPPRPQSRLCLDQSGLQVVIRYPSEMGSAVETADEVARRLLEVISSEPTLKLVGQLAPNIQAATPPRIDGASLAK